MRPHYSLMRDTGNTVRVDRAWGFEAFVGRWPPSQTAASGRIGCLGRPGAGARAGPAGPLTDGAPPEW